MPVTPSCLDDVRIR